MVRNKNFRKSAERYWQCERKVTFHTKGRAKKAIKAMRGRLWPLNVYRCPWCDYYHVGRIKDWKKQEET